MASLAMARRRADRIRPAQRQGNASLGVNVSRVDVYVSSARPQKKAKCREVSVRDSTNNAATYPAHRASADWSCCARCARATRRFARHG
eukprot:447977-Pleurochrysis_carterae.AAC.2